LKIIGQFAKGMRPCVHLSYDDFMKWLNINVDMLDDLFPLEGSSIIEENIGKAAELFIYFQAFLVSFLSQNLETITFRRIYSGFNYFLQKYLSNENPDFGDISIVVDETHEKDIKDAIKVVHKQVDKYELINFTPPSNNKDSLFHAGISKDVFQVECHQTSLTNKNMALWEKVDFGEGSKSGIGKAVNYVFYCKTKL